MLIDREFATTLAALAEEVSAAGDPTETAEQVVALAAAELDAKHVGIVLVQGRHQLVTAAATTDLIEQTVCLAAPDPYRDPVWHHQDLVVDLRWDQRWPEWSTAVHDLGGRHMIAVELLADGRRAGVLCVFSEDHSFSDNDLAFAHIFGRHSALALEASNYREHIQAALDGRKLIGQAQGMLMERYRLNDLQAFALLKRVSQTQNRKMREIAAELVTTGNIDL